MLSTDSGTVPRPRGRNLLRSFMFLTTRREEPHTTTRDDNLRSVLAQVAQTHEITLTIIM